MLSKVATAIFNIYDGSAALKALIPGGMYWEYQPEGTTDDYVVYSHVSTTFDEYGGGADVSTKLSVWNLNVFVSDKSGTDEMNSITTKLRDLYNWQTLSISGYTFISARINSIDNVIVDDGYWQSVLELEIRFT